MTSKSVEASLLSLLQRTPESRLESTDTLLLEELAYLEEELARAKAAAAEDKAQRVSKLLQNLRDRMRDAINNVEIAMQSNPQGMEWIPYHDETTGQLYYYNAQTGKTQWEKPFSENTQLPFGWTEHISNGVKFYHNRSTGESSYTVPH
eukprot:c3169_g1_i1.p1 GENE.c3169_g1_i1~~c3169_g1_i1.p1  ORF type:complete len:149 (+),score=36.08 c3169_g1_i1:53-499(+)